MDDSSRIASAREQLLIRYFRKIPVPPTHEQAKSRMILGTVLAALALLFALTAPGAAPSALAVAVALASALAFGRATARYLKDKYAHEKSLVSVFPQPSDREVDLWFDEAIERLEAESLEILELTREQCESAEPRCIRSPVLWYTAGVDPADLVWKVGQDGMARFGVYQISYLWLAEDLVGIFRCDYDFIRDAVLNEQTQEFFYGDILSISTRREASALSLPTGQSLLSKEEFKITVAGDQHFEMMISSDELWELTGAEKVPDDGLEATINALRTKIRDKKAGSAVA